MTKGGIDYLLADSTLFACFLLAQNDLKMNGYNFQPC